MSKQETYYRVPNDMRFVNKRTRELVELVGGELLTLEEVNDYTLDPKKLEIVTVNCKQVYFVFGVRFADDEESKWRWAN